MALSRHNIVSFWTRLPFALIGALAFSPYFFHIAELGIPYTDIGLPVANVMKAPVEMLLSFPMDIWDALIFLAYPENDQIWYRHYLSAGLASALMYQRALLAESARRGVKLSGVWGLSVFMFLFWPLFAALLIKEYFVRAEQAKDQGQTYDAVPYLVFVEAPVYALGYTVVGSVLNFLI